MRRGPWQAFCAFLCDDPDAIAELRATLVRQARGPVTNQFTCTVHIPEAHRDDAISEVTLKLIAGGEAIYDRRRAWLRKHLPDQGHTYEEVCEVARLSPDDPALARVEATFHGYLETMLANGELTRQRRLGHEAPVTTEDEGVPDLDALPGAVDDAMSKAAELEDRRHANLEIRGVLDAVLEVSESWLLLPPTEVQRGAWSDLLEIVSGQSDTEQLVLTRYGVSRDDPGWARARNRLQRSGGRVRSELKEHALLLLVNGSIDPSLCWRAICGLEFLFKRKHSQTPEVPEVLLPHEHDLPRVDLSVLDGEGRP